MPVYNNNTGWINWDYCITEIKINVVTNNINSNTGN